MTTPENLDLLFHHIEMLNMMLRPTRWHGKDIIWAGLPGAPTVREMFDALLHDIEKLRADNERLFVNETEALNRMTRAENRANLVDAKLRNREEKIFSLRHQIDELRTVLGEIEWASDGTEWYCPWCKASVETGHKPDCRRQMAMGRQITVTVSGTLEAA